MKFDVPFIPMPPLSDPTSGYPGFNPHTEVYPKGYQAQPERLPFSCDTVCEQDAAVVLRDGVTIYADVYRPVGAEKVPALLSWGPSGKRGRNLAAGLPQQEASPDPGAPTPAQPPKHPDNSRLSGLQYWNGQDPAIWVGFGYAVVNADPRGVYASEGDVQYFGTTDALDGRDVIEWIAAQSWCSGKVGMAGNHWMGIEQWFIASQRPPHLAAIAPADAHADLYADEFVRGGIPRLDETARQRSYGSGRLEDICYMAERCPFMNEYWEDKAAKVENIEIPVYVTGSYTQTNHSRGVFKAFNAIASKEKWLRIHDIGEFMDPREEATVLDLKKFFDRYLKGLDNGWEQTPRVRLAVFDPGGENLVGRPEESFPLARQQVKSLYLDAASGALTDAPPAAEASVTYRADDSRGCGRFTYRFEEDTELTGYLSLRLWLEADGADDADVFVRLFKLGADGEALYSEKGNRYSGPNGRLRASHRALDESLSTVLEPYHTHRTEQLLRPGEIVPLDIEIWPTSLLFHKGEQLMAEIAGFEIKVAHFGSDMIETKNRGTHILHTGGRCDSRLNVPVIPR